MEDVNTQRQTRLFLFKLGIIPKNFTGAEFSYNLASWKNRDEV